MENAFHFGNTANTPHNKSNKEVRLRLCRLDEYVARNWREALLAFWIGMPAPLRAANGRLDLWYFAKCVVDVV
eukprot:3851121-Pyramimonas_sp.AAC.1